ncbi:MAG: hypothetical protein AAF652_19685 [Cyanobacteria bacterium P01_C01_bin.72]
MRFIPSKSLRVWQHLRSALVLPRISKCASGDVNMLKKGGSKLCRTEFYLWVTTDIAKLNSRPQSDIGQLICNKYDAWVSQFENDSELRQQQLAVKTQSKAIKSMRAIVSVKS